MKLFLVCPREESTEKIENRIKEHFDNHYIQLPNRPFPSWVLAADKYLTSAEVCRLLGMLEEDPPNRGIVAEMGSYYGNDSVELWQKLDAWTRF